MLEKPRKKEIRSRKKMMTWYAGGYNDCVEEYDTWILSELKELISESICNNNDVVHVDSLAQLIAKISNVEAG